jgi:hypothetical protein
MYLIQQSTISKQFNGPITKARTPKYSHTCMTENLNWKCKYSEDSMLFPKHLLYSKKKCVTLCYSSFFFQSTSVLHNVDKHRDVEADRRHWSTAPHIPDLSTRWRQQVRCFTPEEKFSRTHRTKAWVGLRAGPDITTHRNVSVPESSWTPVNQPVAVTLQTELSRLTLYTEIISYSRHINTFTVERAEVRLYPPHQMILLNREALHPNLKLILFSVFHKDNHYTKPLLYHNIHPLHTV